MSKSKITGKVAFSHMNVWRLQNKVIRTGICHKTCQDAWGLPVKYASAIDAWNHVPKKARHTDPSKAPIGAPHFWAGGHYGHVALQSDEKGIAISTDAPNPGHVGKVKLTWFSKYWGYKYLGWASIYNDVELQLTEMPK